MNLREMIAGMAGFLPALSVVAVAVVFFVLTNLLLRRRAIRLGTDPRVPEQLATLAIRLCK